MEKKATWIWYPGDFEVWLGNRFNNRRTERGSMFPPFWKQDSHWPTIVFAITVRLEQTENVKIFSEGQPNISIDGHLQRIELSPFPNAPSTGQPSPEVRCTELNIPPGEHRITVKIWNQLSPPALFIDGPTIKTGKEWEVTFEDKIWIDEQGKAHDSGIYVPAASWCEVRPSSTTSPFDSPSSPPSAFHLPTRPGYPVSSETTAAGTLYDFGQETFGFLRFSGLRGEGTLRIYYGESREEALDCNRCETLDICRVNADMQPTILGSKAFRYVCIDREGTAEYDELFMDEEYTPFDHTHSGAFSCSDEELNAIWQVSARTMDLTTREFFTDGIKRDRWVWSGDAIQSYLMNYYLRFDTECVKRTIRQLRGKDPVTTHVNTIMDYTFFWFISISQYYQYTADIDFLREVYPRMKTLMDYVLSRTNPEGLIEGMPGDWVFVDWADFPMSKRGALCFEQLLLLQSYETMADVSKLLGEEQTGTIFLHRIQELKRKIKKLFWSSKAEALLHAVGHEGIDRQITKFPNMFAIIFGLQQPKRKPATGLFSKKTLQRIAQNVLLNPTVPPITTPYMRFYELEALCLLDMQPEVLQQIKSYWGGMLRLGATTFWEKYIPEEQGTEHLAMYGRPYGKSLCHSWGASPIYIIGRYFLGVRPIKHGYESYEVRPVLGGLKWMEGEVPTPFGKIHVRMDETSVTVQSDGGQGRLIVGNQSITIPPHKKVKCELFN